MNITRTVRLLWCHRVTPFCPVGIQARSKLLASVFCLLPILMGMKHPHCHASSRLDQPRGAIDPPFAARSCGGTWLKPLWSQFRRPSPSWNRTSSAFVARHALWAVQGHGVSWYGSVPTEPRERALISENLVQQPIVFGSHVRATSINYMGLNQMLLRRHQLVSGLALVGNQLDG